MVKDRKIVFAEKEVILEVTTYPDKKKESKTFMWKEIVSVKVVKGVENKFFFKKPYERIEIQTTNPETPQYLMPITFEKKNEKEDFDEYVKEFEKYSKERTFKFEDKR